MNRSLKRGSLLALAALVLTAAPSLAKPAKKSAPPPRNRAVVQTSDGTVMRGRLLYFEQPLITLRTEDGEDHSFPVSEINSINGQTPKNYLKRFVPMIPEEAYTSYDFPAKSGDLCVFKFLGDWEKGPQTYGLAFVAPETDLLWQGFRFYINLEPPPSDLSYPSVVKKLSDRGKTVTQENFEIARGTQALFTVESQAAVRSKTASQFVESNGQKFLLQLTLAHPAPEKINSMITSVLLKDVLNSVRLEAPKAP